MRSLSIGNTKLKVKTATTPAAMARGLMHISSLPADEGFLFCYPKEDILSFWMKNTKIPLSIAFIDKNKKITQIENMEPYDETGIKSNKPAKWALEVNSGWFDDHNISVGDKVDIPKSKKIKIRVLALPPEANQLTKAIEDKLVDMTVKALKSKFSVDKLGDLNIDVEVEE